MIGTDLPPLDAERAALEQQLAALITGLLQLAAPEQHIVTVRAVVLGVAMRVVVPALQQDWLQAGELGVDTGDTLNGMLREAGYRLERLH